MKGHAAANLHCPACGSTNLEVCQRHCNFSAFNGYHHTPSDYSGVRCRDCGNPWRTKSRKVEALPDAN